jgi:glycosyltransferase involved in cell wall biosynthesis
MKILIIGKYPPIEGGVSAHTYWLARSLGERGHQVAVVTNAWRVEAGYREQFDRKSQKVRAEYLPKNVTLYTFEDQMPAHIPYSEAYVTRLVNKALEAIEKQGADVVYVHYLEPYGTAALLLKKLTGIPYVIRHAGSDIYRLLKSPDLSLVLGRVLLNADRVLLASSLHTIVHTIGIPNRRIGMLPRRAMPALFSPTGSRYDFNFELHDGTPIVGYLGKATELKGLEEILEACAKSRPALRLALFTNGYILPKLKAIVENDTWLNEHVRFFPFVPPWEVPSILRALDGLLHLENRFPIPIHSPLILSEEMKKKLQFTLPDIGDYVTTVQDPTDIASLSDALTAFASNTRHNHSKAEQLAKLCPNDWDAQVKEYEDALTRVVSGGMLRRLASLFSK